jgi:hypothetical protein
MPHPPRLTSEKQRRDSSHQIAHRSRSCHTTSSTTTTTTSSSSSSRVMQGMGWRVMGRFVQPVLQLLQQPKAHQSARQLQMQDSQQQEGWTALSSQGKQCTLNNSSSSMWLLWRPQSSYWLLQAKCSSLWNISAQLNPQLLLTCRYCSGS